MSEAIHFLGLPLKHKLKEIKPTDYSMRNKVLAFEANGTLYDVYGDPTYGLVVEERSTGTPAILLYPNGLVEIWNDLSIPGGKLRGAALGNYPITFQDGINDIFTIKAVGNELRFIETYPTTPPTDYIIFRLKKGASPPLFQFDQDLVPNITNQRKLGNTDLRFLEIWGTIKPQGVGSGLDADKVDGLHAAELGGGGPHASSHETGGGDKVHFADLEHDEGDATLHDALTAAPHISQSEKDKIHDRLHPLSSALDHSGEITDAQHGNRCSGLHADSHPKPLFNTVIGTSDLTTTSSVFVDMTGMSINFTTTSTKIILAIFSAYLYISKAGEDYGWIRLLIDGVNEAEGYFGDNRSGAVTLRQVVTIHAIKSLSAGSHNVKIQWRSQAGRTVGAPYYEKMRRLTVLELAG